MLALTGAKADGWLPSMSYVELDDLPRMNAAIDAAAVEAGRSPTDVRRMININPGTEPEQLAELTLEQGFSAYILSVSSGEDIRRFAEETAPAVRDLVEAGRSGSAAEAARATAAAHRRQRRRGRSRSPPRPTTARA